MCEEMGAVKRRVAGEATRAAALIGEWLSMMGKGNKGWWLWGATGWEYLELGKVWQFLFIAAMGLWVFILLRGFMRPIPIALGIPPQPGERVRESGWRLGDG